MKYMLVIYDCDICGKKHILKTDWTLEHEIEIKKKWAKNLVDEVVEGLLKEAVLSFAKIHPNKIFNEDRLMFSQVFEEEENEEGTDKG